jgi:hypothetical protein
VRPLAFSRFQPAVCLAAQIAALKTLPQAASALPEPAAQLLESL